MRARQLKLNLGIKVPRFNSYLSSAVRQGFVAQSRATFSNGTHIGFKQSFHIYLLCPCSDHRERTPSCVYDFKRKKFHCYGCGRNGSPRRLGVLMANARYPINGQLISIMRDGIMILSELPKVVRSEAATLTDHHEDIPF